ncbi:MAG: NUDIX domain-containing protein [Candidatus Micrarchaeota archaeon]
MVAYGALVVAYRITARGREFLLVKNTRSKRWSFPAGHVDEGEEHSVAALRELQEETTLKREDLVEFKNTGQWNVFYDDECVQVRQKVFVALVNSEAHVQAGDMIDEFKWVAEADVPKVLTELSLRELYAKIKSTL